MPIWRLRDFGCEIDVYDPWADEAEVKHEYGVSLTKEPKDKYDAVVLAVAHKEFKGIKIESLAKEDGVIYDIKGFLPKGVADRRL